MKIAISLAAAALALTPTSAFAATNIVSNGSFELGTDPGSYSQAPPGTIDDWTVTGTVDYIGSYWTAQDGSRSVDLAGSSLGAISQVLSTVIGQTYDVSFWTSKNPDGGAPTRTGVVDFGGSSQIFSYSANNNRSDMMWQLVTYSFTATNAATLLSFAADASAGCCYGPALDNVSVVVATPEPATWLMLILGFGLAGTAVRTARRRKAGMFA